MTNIEDQIRAELSPAPMDATERELLWVEVLAARDRPHMSASVRPKRLGWRSHRALLLAAAFVLLITGVAAASTDVVQKLFADDAPVVDRVDQLRDPKVERATPEEYQTIQETNLVPAVKRLGVLRPDEMKPVVELAGIEQSRVLIDDPDIGRVVAVPTTDGKQWCYSFRYAIGSTFGFGSGGCGGAFGPHGVAPSFSGGGNLKGQPPEYRIYGTASDDVTKLGVEVPDGDIEPVLLRDNVFMWRSTTKPVALHIWRDDRHDVERSPMP